MIALSITLAVLFLLAVTPVGVRAVYDRDLTVYFTVLGFRIQVYPGKEKPQKQKKRKEASPAADKSKPERTSGELQDYLQLLTRLLGKMRRKILIRELTLHAIFGGDDPALNYGRAWALLGVTMPLLEETFRIRKRDVGAYCGEEETFLRLYARAHAVLTVADILHLCMHALRGWLKIKKSRKPEKAV